MVAYFGQELSPTRRSPCRVEVPIHSLSRERRRQDTVTKTVFGVDWTCQPAL